VEIGFSVQIGLNVSEGKNVGEWCDVRHTMCDARHTSVYSVTLVTASVTLVTGTTPVPSLGWAWLLLFVSKRLLFAPPFLPFSTFASNRLPEINRKEIPRNI
jgi:hypothetical protein